MADSAIRYVLLMVKVHLQERHAAVGIAGIDRAKGSGFNFLSAPVDIRASPDFQKSIRTPNLFGRTEPFRTQTDLVGLLQKWHLNSYP